MYDISRLRVKEDAGSVFLQLAVTIHTRWYLKYSGLVPPSVQQL
jgi:hypothetical protein